MEYDSVEENYVSPVMQKFTKRNELTLALLNEKIPVVRRGQEAKLAIQDLSPNDPQIQQLQWEVSEGEKAQELLVMVSIPLVKHLAAKEHQRRQNWKSQVTYEELFQEGISGLMRGLNAYKVNNSKNSPTNYLGQWIVVEMRRNLEHLDNDFNVSYDASERYRKIRALRSRLSGELGREPTDLEIIEASKDPAYRGGKNMGRVNKGNSTGRSITQKHLDDEKATKSRVGYGYRIANSSDNNEDNTGEVYTEHSAPVWSDSVIVSDEERIVETEAKESLATLVNKTIEVMNIGEVQKDIISRKYGLPPYTKEYSPREISLDIGLSREKIAKVLDAFSKEITKAGGTFHRICSALNEDELASIGLRWVMQALGDYNEVDLTKVKKPDNILSSSLRVGMAEELVVVGNLSGNVYATYKCSYHKTNFTNLYSTVKEAYPTINCSQCGNPSALIRLEGE